MSERSMHDPMEGLRCAYEQGDGRDQAEARVALLAAWEADVARIATLEAERDRLRTALDGQTDYTIRLQRIIERLAAGAPPVQAGDSECHLSDKATAVADRLATLEARVAALVPLAEDGLVWRIGDEADADCAAAHAALAAIAAETTTTTETPNERR